MVVPLPTYVPMELLSKRQREETHEPFARYLIELSGATAALWVRWNTVYRALGLDCWTIERDANLYDGPGPIIAHPPCGPWGKYAHVSKESKSHGIRAMELVHRFGGVVEQPRGSTLFKEYGSSGQVLRVMQHDYGHPALKPTDLYIVNLGE